MIITYRSNKLKKQAENLKELSKAYGSHAKQVKRRFEELKAAENLAIIGKIPGANCHQLSGKNYQGYLAVNISGNMRLIFEPNHNPLPRNESGGLDWSQITEITIEELCFDYH
jgi:proteic killer suppression protein